ncbi:MAG: LCP family protein, partial [bacterium]|nr:LCP family protein [bacterium]
MDDLKINFLGPEEKDPSRKKFFFFLKIFGALVLSLGLLFILISSNNAEEGFLASLNEIPVIKQVRDLVRSADRTLDGQKEDRLNILLLGMGGVGHDGPFLTDTIILASIKPSTNQIALTSIPRDMAAPIPDYGWYKINHANAFGEAKESGSGGELTREVLSDVLDLPIHYFVRVDFDGFTKLIDDLGGLDVYVDNSFVDEQYPTDKNGEVQTLEFDKGWQHMNGERALEFARSRHGGNNESGDFARARRQQKILQAAKDKIFSLGTLRSPSKISAIYETLSDHVRTNFSPWELLALSRLANALNTENLITSVLDDSPNGLLEPTIGLDGAYLLIPRNNNWQTVRESLKEVFGTEAPKIEKKSEVIKIEIQNGTYLPGLAGRV